MLKTVLGDNTVERTQTFEWISRLKRGENSVEDCQHPSRPSAGHAEEIAEKAGKIVKKYGESTILETSNMPGLSYGSCQRKIKHLNMKCLYFGCWKTSWRSGACLCLMKPKEARTSSKGPQQNKKPGLTVISQKSNSSPVSMKPAVSTSDGSEACQSILVVFFGLWGHC